MEGIAARNKEKEVYNENTRDNVSGVRFKTYLFF